MDSFSELPIELIRLVASFTSYDSVHTLSRVSHRFWAACHDWTVFKALLRHTHYEAYRYLLHKQSPSLLRWKHFAYAESRAAIAHVDAPDFLLWVPQLLALHYPLGATIDAACLLKDIGRESVLNARIYAFCFCIRALAFKLPPSGATDSFYSSFDCKYPVATCISDWSCRALDPSVTKLSAMGPLWNEDRLMSTDEWPVERDQMHAIALKALAFLSIEVKSAAVRQALVFQPLQPVEQSQLRRSSDFAVPMSDRKIPFESFMDLPLPYSVDSVTHFTTCHLPAMANRSFIEEGEWSGVEFGCRTHPYQAPQVVCLTPFKLKVTSQEAVSDVVEIQSCALTSAKTTNRFQISLKTSSGVAIMTVKHDLLSESDNWQGILTPFGFVGTTSLSSGAWFWLWKATWAENYRPRYDWTKLWGRGNIDLVQRAVAERR